MDIIAYAGDTAVHVLSTHRADAADETPLQMISAKRLAQLEQVEVEHELLLRHLAELGACRAVSEVSPSR